MEPKRTAHRITPRIRRGLRHVLRATNVAIDDYLNPPLSLQGFHELEDVQAALSWLKATTRPKEDSKESE
jgi:hypothetical protein